MSWDPSGKLPILASDRFREKGDDMNEGLSNELQKQD
jgi:hypothetical protein